MLTMLLPGKKFSPVALGTVMLTAVLAAAVLTAVPAAADFPSWEEVEEAKHSVAAREAQAADIEALLGKLSAEAGSLGNAAVSASADSERAAGEAEAGKRAVEILAAQRVEAASKARVLTTQMGALAAQILAGVSLARGRAPRLSSTVLAASLLPTTVAGHQFWKESDPTVRTNQQIHFFKNLSMLGGLMLAAVDTEGRPGVAWRAKNAAGGVRREAKHLRREAKLQSRLAAKSLTS